MTFDLIKSTHEFLTRGRLRAPSVPHLYPSEASVSYMQDDQQVILGNCARSTYWRYTGIPGAPSSVYLQMTGKLGKSCELMLLDMWKQMGILYEEHIRFQNAQYNLSGELDCIVRDPETGILIGLECFVPNTLVLDSKYRLVPIQELNVADSIIGHTLDQSQILNCQQQEVNTKVYRLYGKFDGLYSEVTGEHPFLTAEVHTSRLKVDNKRRSRQVISTTWKKARDLKRGDYICIPKAKFGIQRHKISICDILQQTQWPYRIINDRIYSQSYNALAQEQGIPLDILEKDLEDFYWWLGLYIAEGSCSAGSIYFSLHQDEYNIITRLQEVTQKIFGLTTKIRSCVDTRTKKLSKGINICINSKAIREFIKHIIPGTSCTKTKYIDYSYIDPRFLRSLLQGIAEGDGTVTGCTGESVKISTVVPHLAFLYFQLMAHLGLSPNLKKVQQQSLFKSQYIYTVSSSYNNTKRNQIKLVEHPLYWCYPISKTSTRQYSGYVYNLETFPDHTYTAGMCVVHNCKTLYGYYAGKGIFGTKNTVGKPKDKHLLQTIIYAREFYGILDHFQIPYLERGDGSMKTFKVSVMPDEVDGEIIYRPLLNDELITDYTIDDMYARYSNILAAVAAKRLPEREFQYKWSNEKVEMEFAAGNLSKSAYEAFKTTKKNGTVSYHEKERPGDWTCSYCSHRKLCYTDVGECVD